MVLEWRRSGRVGSRRDPKQKSQCNSTGSFIWDPDEYYCPGARRRECAHAKNSFHVATCALLAWRFPAVPKGQKTIHRIVFRRKRRRPKPPLKYAHERILHPLLARAHTFVARRKSNVPVYIPNDKSRCIRTGSFCLGSRRLPTLPERLHSSTIGV